MQLLFRESNDIHDISVYETTELYGEKGLFRVLQFSNDAIQGALDVNNPARILFEYPRAIIHLMEMNHRSFEHVFVIGHGIGTIAGHLPEKRFKIAELDVTVVELSKRFFQYTQNNVVIGDGRLILEQEEPHTYDYLILDAFTSKGTPRHLTSQAFFKLTREKLQPEGSVIMNLFGKGQQDRLIHAIHTTLREEFAYSKTFALPADGARDVQNMIMIGRNKPIDYQARHLAGFIEIEIEPGYLIRD
ncbi:fused MFS/spermidine synthase [Paenibacillus alba]|uniref:spermidine synthase n=1 Tax=Paenibacillus alba TaxID=1197127 RepID=UPI0015646B34|nr:fused MFS/spermidine synthase [Paenibacillus alba]NQX68715.1 fused MFS/spermidine synthase [Paenibacillus alba]